MSTENVAQITSSSEALQSQHEFRPELDKCTYIADANEIFMHYTVKEYENTVQKSRDYSTECTDTMLKIKITKSGEKQNYVCSSKLNNTCNNNYNNSNLQHCENSSGELQYDQSCDAASSQFETESDSESFQNSHTSFHGNSNEQLQWDQACETASSRFEIEGDSNSESTLKNHTSIHENSNEQMQWDQTCEVSNSGFEAETDSESTQNSHTNFHGNFNELQWDQICETASSRFETEADSNSESTLNNHTSFQPNLDSEIGFKLTQNCLTNFQTDNSQIHDCRKDTNELLPSSKDFEESQNFKPNILLDIKIEPPDHDSNSKEYQEFPVDLQRNQNHPPDSVMETNLDIKIKTCDIDSYSMDTQDCDEHAQFVGKLQIKSEPCDIDSDPLVSECSKKIESHSESFEKSNEICDHKIDHSSCSPTMEVKSEKPDIENEATSLPNQDLKRSRRNSKRKREMEDRCPVCGLTVRYADLESHFAKEVENLANIAKNVRKNRASYKDREGFRCGVNLGFVQAKCNRENRLAARRAKYSKKQAVFCPICKIRLSGTEEEINDHVLRCFGEDDDSDINVTDYDEAFEEYEIGNETRIRAISLVPGGHSALHGYSSKSKSTNDEDDGVDVNVDVDDTVVFGEPQYTELDVIHNTIDASNEKEEQLRRAVVSDPSAEPHIIEGKKWSRDSDIQNDIDEIVGSCMKNKPEEEKSKEENETVKVENNSKEDKSIQNTDSNIISSLKEKIKDLEQQKNVKCLICLEPYTRPVVSTTCWHVHCEECWLVSMGVKKLCPQCNMIVFPTDLRRIYL